jgi:site-specific DNA-methyltransferase (adenine-specific)
MISLENLPINEIICGDAADVLKSFPSNSINLVITSPPYFQQRKYGGGEIGSERYIDGYIDALMEVFHELVRLLKEDGSIVFNIGDKYSNGNLLLIPYRFAIRVSEKENVSIVNNITWIKKNPTPRQFNRRLVSSTEPFFHFVKSKKYYYNIEEFQNNFYSDNSGKAITSYSKKNGENKIGQHYKDLIGSSDLSDEQKIMAFSDLNTVIDEVKRGVIFDFRMKIRGIHSPAFGGQSGGRASQIQNKGYTIIRMHGKQLKRDIIVSSVETSRNFHHPAVYPQSIIEEFIKLLTKPNEMVLDPFIGSGTTAIAATVLGRKYTGIDINPEYVSLTKQRLKNDSV